ncbi:hypothetical protein [Caulobacter sp. RL271]|uniref:Head-to-tail stopper n=1 Tax=Caulobacter segnis TaxID=88688 RepID=A0ABY4ZWN2_9CAUL|nr:hypothetical protein [Caulobacter segnis]USQ97247.1 hypothetical protein MZV50_06810 [Caulobacter segnis]
MTVTPMIGGGPYGSPQVDPAREPFDVVGALIVGAGSQVGFSDKSDLQIPDGKAEAYVDPVAWPKIRALKSGDVVRSKDHPTSEFEVERLDRHQVGRLVFRLSVKEICP